MSIDVLGSNINSSTLDLFKQLREARKAMEAAVQSGDIKAAQQSLATIQQDQQSLQSGQGSPDAGRGDNPYRSVLKTDLSNLTAAIQAGDIGAAQSALQTFQQDRAAQPAADAGDPSSSASGTTGNPFLDDLKTLLAAALSGDTNGVQNAATALQKDLQSAGVEPTSDNTQATDAAGNTAPAGQSQNPFLDDLTALISAAQSKDTAGMKDAAKDLAQDIQSAVGGDAPGAVGGRHHHHHHHAVEASNATADAASNPAASAPAGDGDGDHDDRGAATPSQPSAAPVSSALKNAREAYELLMSFSQEATKAA